MVQVLIFARVKLIKKSVCDEAWQLSVVDEADSVDAEWFVVAAFSQILVDIAEVSV